MSRTGSTGRSAYQRGPGGLIAALVVLLVVIGLFVAVRSLTRGNQDNPVSTVDYSLLLQRAREDGKVLAPVPDPMPSGWRATSVRYSAAKRSWHLGVLTPKETYVGIEERPVEQSRLASAFVGKSAREAGPVQVGGEQWTAWRSGERYGLTRGFGDASILVGGPAGRVAVTELAKQVQVGPTPGGVASPSPTAS